MNLTAIKGAQDVARMHFLDSLALLKTADFHNAKIIDIGSGAGFPGIPLKLAEPTINLTLLEATGRKVAFLKELCTALGIDAECMHARAEEAAHIGEMRESYDIAVSRAVAKLDMLCEICLPFVRVGGVLLAMKGADVFNELEEASSAITALGGELESIANYLIPTTEITHTVVIIRKRIMTIAKYPRRYAKIRKTPI